MNGKIRTGKSAPYYQPTDRSENGKRTRESGWIARASTVKIPFEMDWMVLVFQMLDKLLQAHKPCSSTKFVKWSQDQNRDRPFLGEVFGVIGEGAKPLVPPGARKNSF